jgi:hypothetical protein
MLAPNPRLQRTPLREPLSRKPLGRKSIVAATVAAVLLAGGCSTRLTHSRAARAIQHSTAFSAAPDRPAPVFVKVTAMLAGNEDRTPERQESRTYLVGFAYHWPERAQAFANGQKHIVVYRSPTVLMANVVLRRGANGWQVDERLTKALTPTRPILPGDTSASGAGSR